MKNELDGVKMSFLELGDKHAFHEQVSLFLMPSHGWRREKPPSHLPHLNAPSLFEDMGILRWNGLMLTRY
jgi:hypothetical protein